MSTEFADLPDCPTCDGSGKDPVAVAAWEQSAPTPEELAAVLDDEWNQLMSDLPRGPAGQPPGGG